MNRHDPLLRMALQIQRQLARRRGKASEPLQAAVGKVLERQQCVESAWRQFQKAHQRHWHAAARYMQGMLFQQAHLLQDRVTELLHLEAQHVQVQPEVPNLGLLIEELRQLQREFDSVEIDPQKQMISVQIPSIDLEGVTLGSFDIQLHLDRLGRRLDSGVFDCNAVKPYAASSDESVTHPHVRDKVLCAGDAAVPLSQALIQGRIADAFCLVHSVLKAYNPHSAYVPLDSWDGVSCPDCGGSVGSDDLYRCNACDNDYCESCISRCELCDDSTCSDCLERDPVTHRYCCPSCRGICNTCGRVVEKDEFDEETGLCPGCRDEQGDESTTETTHEQEDQQSTAQPAAA